jgi:DMSO/TMAO reductase YedYZ molybdopterin-dependent catalytic subunit
MPIISRGFSGRRGAEGVQLPPGQYVTTDFPVLSAGPTPNVPLDQWEFVIDHGASVLKRWNWKSFRDLPTERFTTDIHCVTRWSKLGTSWEGVSLDTILAEVDSADRYAMVRSYGGYTTNVPLEDLKSHQAWVAFRFEGQDLEPEHGGPARLLVPHLYFWKSAKWVRGITLVPQDKPGFWESNGYHLYGDPWREQRYSGE